MALVRRTVPFREISVQQQKDIDSLKAATGGAQLPSLIVGSQRKSGFLENAGYPRLSMFTVWPVMGAVWAVLAIAENARNR